MNPATPTIGIVLPCYNEEEILLQTDRKIGELMEQLIIKKLIAPGSSIIYVDDGSKDKTWSSFKKGLVIHITELELNSREILVTRQHCWGNYKYLPTGRLYYHH
jgi:cellulose synthase/poly-beta-1,6-N-acetylglucosamine synthase-like glycosyltransferase